MTDTVDALARALLEQHPLFYAESWPNDDPDDIGLYSGEDAIAILSRLTDEGHTLVKTAEWERAQTALWDIRETCKPMSMSTTGPVWFDGGTPAGGGSRERIWRLADAALSETP